MRTSGCQGAVLGVPRSQKPGQPGQPGSYGEALTNDDGKGTSLKKLQV